MSAAVTEGGTSERLFAEASAVNTSVVESSNEGGGHLQSALFILEREGSMQLSTFKHESVNVVLSPVMVLF